jgi:heat shock protein HspQ
MTVIEAKFHVGQLIHHRLFNYRGVVLDVDPVFQGSEEWYDQVAHSRPPKDKPWYRVLVDEAEHETYVAERNLELDTTGDPIRHPFLDDFFSGLADGSYRLRSPHN